MISLFFGMLAFLYQKAWSKTTKESTQALCAAGPIRYACPMDFKEIELDRIDFEDETFRISETLDSPLLLESIRRVGQLAPALVRAGDDCRYSVVSGFRRARALRQLGAPRILARVLEGLGPAACFDLALWDNLSLRNLETLEQARVVFALKNVFEVAQDRLLSYLPALGLRAGREAVESCLALHAADPGIRACLRQGLLTPASAAWIAAKPRPLQRQMAELMGPVRLSASLQRKLLDLLEDLAAATDSEIGEALRAPEIRSTLADARRSPFQRGENIYNVLYRKRYPTLQGALDRFAAHRKRLGLPGSVRILPDPYFETPGVRVEFEAPSPGRFRELADALLAASRNPALEGLFSP